MNSYSNKKIAIVSSSCPPFITGGISSAHYNLYKMLKGKGFIVKIFTFTDHNSTLQSEEDVTRHGTPPFLLKILNLISRCYYLILIGIEKIRFAYQFPYILESAVGSLRINKTLREFKPDILVLPDNGAPGYFIKKLEGCRNIFISHHNPVRFLDEPLFGIFSKRDAQLAMYIENRTLKKVDKVICPSKYMKEVFNKTHEFTGPVSVIPNLIDNNFIASIQVSDIRKGLGLSDDAPVIYIPSAGSSLKGSRFVFEIIRRLSAFYGKKIGFYLSGSIYDEILERELSFAPDNARIYMPGNLSYYENISTAKGCSYCISPTLIESFGMAILEANFCGLPVVSFDVGGNADIVQNGENGFLVPFLDVEELISISIRLLDKRLMEDMRKRTLDVVTEKFSVDAVSKQYIEFMFEDRF